ncbi:hypothetical protein UlMin_006383 [Ulmus minor]
MSSSHTCLASSIIFFTFLLIFMAANSYPLADKIKKLPGQPSVKFQQFSGYVTVDEKKQRALFYYFVEAQKDPHSKPLVLWLNGGPGCSSVGAGAFTEHGPFLPTNGKTLIKNEYSWNREANMLYLESPAGVGFSYSANKSFYSTLNDKIAARDSLVFLLGWFGKFPEYKNIDFFIAGESYAGHYVPQLAHLILKSKAKINLKGIAIGNPALDFETDQNSMIDYSWSHGLISDLTYKLFTSNCTYSEFYKAIIIEKQDLSPACIRAYQQYEKEYTGKIDIYFIIGNYCITSIEEMPLMQMFHRGLSSNIPQNLFSFDSDSVALDEKKIVGEYEDCIDKKASIYLNRKDVQKALHARLVGTKRWTICTNNKDFNYDSNDLANIQTIFVVGSLVKSGIRVIVYSGDQDRAVPFIGTRRLVNGLAKELGLKTTVPYKAWFESKQVGGWTQVYGDHLSFATIRGASHGTPTTQPARSFLLFKSFLSGKPLPIQP